MNTPKNMRTSRAAIKKQISALTIFALGFSLLGVISAPQASALNNFAAQSILVDASGRAGEKVKVLVSTKLASGVTTSADQVAVAIVAKKTSANYYQYDQSGLSDANMATTQTPSIISPNEAMYSFSLTAPGAGLYFLKTCISTASTPMTWRDLADSFVPWSQPSATADLYCEFELIELGAEPTRAVFSSNNLGAYPVSGTGSASANSQVNFYDANGFMTKLLPSESFTISSSSASVSAEYGRAISAGTGNIPNTSKALVFSGSAGDADGAYRFTLSDDINQVSQVRGQFETTFGSGNFMTPVASFEFSTVPIATSGYKAKLMPNAYQLSMASGTDGKLYYWGQLASYSGDLPSWINGNSNKPKKLDFTSLPGQVNSLTVKKIISSAYVLSNDGVLYRNFSDRAISGIALKKRDLQPVTFPSLADVEIADITTDLSYLIDTQGRLWKKSNVFGSYVPDYQLVDVTSIGSPVFTKIAYSTDPVAIFALTSTGEVYSQGSNTNGLLGQNSNGAPTAFGKVALPDGVTAKNVYAGRGFAWIVTSDGAVWAWGDNGGGKLAKDSVLIPYSVTPILGILPVGIKGTIWNLNPGMMSFLADDSKTVYYASNSGWRAENVSGIGTNTVQDIYWGGSGSIILQQDNRIFSQGNAVGNCISPYAYVRSIGQFGPISTDDSLRYSGIFLQTESGTSTINQTFSMKAGETSTIQVVQPRTNCYDVNELIYNWDLDGSGSYSVPGASSLSQTGYQAFNAVLNFATAGRKEVKLKLSTPDGLDLVLKFTVGVMARVAPVIEFGDTRTSLVSGSGSSTIGIGTDGLVYTWGENNYGQLSTPTNTFAYRLLALPVALPNGAKPYSVFSHDYDYSYRANFVIDTAGKVWGAGSGYSITGSYGNIETFTALSNLDAYNVADIQMNMYRAFLLTKSGQLLMWQLGTTGPARVPAQIVSLAGIDIKNFTVQRDSSYGSRISAVDTDGNLWQVPINSNDIVGEATKISSITDIRQLSWNGTQAMLVTGAGEVWFSVNGSTPFARITIPVGVTAVDAMYSSYSSPAGVLLLDSNRKIWTATASQAGNTVTMSTWTAYAAQANGQTSSNDQPIFQHRGSSFISFASGNLLYTGSYGSYQAGRCNVSGTGTFGNRVYSTGQFGTSNIVDQISTSASVAIASQNASNFVSGQFFSANPGDALVIRMVNPTSGCFNGSSQLTAVADTSGTGNFNTVVPLSNEGGGTYSFTLSGTAPTSGRKSISIRISTPLNTSSTFSLGLGVFGTETITAIVPRTNPVVTSDAAAFAIASDGFAYGWSTPTDVSYDYNGSTMAFMNTITSTPPRNSGTPTKLQIPGNPRVREAIPFTYCCSRTYGRYVFGVLAVDEFGRTWTWASEAGIHMASTYAFGSVPTTATQVPGLIGENVVRLAVSPDGQRAMALTSKGIVYTWADNYADNMMISGSLTKVASLAGLRILDIHTTNNMSYALTDSGELYAFNGYSAHAGIGATYQWNEVSSATKVVLPETVTAFMNIADSSITAVKSSSGKIYVWGQYYNRATGSNIPLLTPVRIDLPGSRTPGSVGTIHHDGYSSNVITASDGTWWDMAANAQNQITLYQRTGVSSAVNATVAKFALGAGQAMVLNNGSIYTTNGQIAGTCGPIGTYTRVMSEGQFGPLYKADQIYINVYGDEITRPNTATSVSVTGWSACDGGANITMTADYVGNSVFGDSRTATVSQDGSRATSTFTFTKTQNGPVYMQFKATTAAGLSGTETFFTKVVPAPLPGRQIGISINAGDRYTNSSNVNLSLVWPDGTTKIYVSNDGGFAPGTVSDYDLQYTVPWVLPPQAVIPLPSIVYARFDNDPNTYYFDDIILDAITPVLTYASAR